MRGLSYSEIKLVLTAWMTAKDGEMHPSLDYCQLSGLAFTLPDSGNPEDISVFVCDPIQYGNTHIPGTRGNYRSVDNFVHALRHEGLTYSSILDKLTQLCLS